MSQNLMQISPVTLETCVVGTFSKHRSVFPLCYISSNVLLFDTIGIKLSQIIKKEYYICRGDIQPVLLR